jgi:formate hydrogenlyase subunit 4
VDVVVEVTMLDASTRIAAGLFQGFVLILFAPLSVGLLRWLEARLQRRQGPGILQPYRDLAKLLAKPAVRPAQASIIFASTPFVLFAVYGVVAFMLPVFSQDTLLRGDLIVIVYLWGLARFTLSLAGLDAGASFGSLGASREMFLHFLTEIGLALLVIVLAIRWDTTSLADILQQHWSLGLLKFLVEPELVLLGIALFLLILFEAERIPVDNPATHLELTMAQRAVTLEFAGRDLALVEWAEAIKLLTLLTLLCHLFIPLPLEEYLTPLGGGSTAIVTAATAMVSYAVRIGLLLIGLALWEAHQPKRRLRNVSRFVFISIALSATAILYALAFVSAPGGAS